MYLKTLDKYECCGCTACEQVCAKGAISMVQDKEGFSYPVINKDLCVNCGLCEKVCAFAQPQYTNSKSPAVYATHLKETEERKKSSSGGIFYAIAKWVIAQGGIVYGAAFNKELQLSHIGIEDLNDLEKLRGSKYLQSALDNTYKEVREQLKQSRWVYFVGTGCQVAGLKAFLRKEYTTLVTSDLVCHGVPSQKLFNKHIEYLGKKVNGKIIGYKFRDTKQWGQYEKYIYKKKNKVNYKLTGHYSLSPYIYAFESLYTQRYSCYDCKYTQIPRQGDITLADYWGVKEFFPQIDAKTGVSLVLVNNEQGKKAWEEIKDGLEYHESCVEHGAKYNGNLVRQTKEPAIRKGIYERIESEGYEKVAKTVFRPKNYRKIKLKQAIKRSNIFKIVRRIIKRK